MQIIMQQRAIMLWIIVQSYQGKWCLQLRMYSVIWGESCELQSWAKAEEQLAN